MSVLALRTGRVWKEPWDVSEAVTATPVDSNCSSALFVSALITRERPDFITPAPFLSLSHRTLVSNTVHHRLCRQQGHIMEARNPSGEKKNEANWVSM